ncbi:MAG: UvrB/UvrC motif-containing protein [Phycisphaerae bacterium]|nr:UvrB/UvrC motif-containing protein [Phycisphaerae bacterium]
MAEFDEELFEASLCIESNEWTKDTLSGLPACKGVLFFTDASDQPIQLLQVANLRRTAQAKLIHEEPLWPHRKTDISELTTKIFYTCCDNNFEMQLTYIQLAHAVFQKNAGDWIQLPKISLAVIETDSYLPFFYVSDNPKTDENRKAFGLFPSRKAAAAFCETLNAVFELCRNPSLLNTGRETSCPYLQMQTCPGPCLGTGNRKSYSDAVQRACTAAAGQIDSTTQQLYEQMNLSAQSMRFEQAATLKKQIESLKQLTGNDFTWVHDLQNLCVLHIDIGAKRKITGKNKKRQLYKAWKITAKDIYELGIFVPQTPEQVMSFLNRRWNDGQKFVYSPTHKEHLAVLSLFLFRSNPSGLWLDCTQKIPEDDLTNGLFHK